MCGNDKSGYLCVNPKHMKLKTSKIEPVKKIVRWRSTVWEDYEKCDKRKLQDKEINICGGDEEEEDPNNNNNKNIRSIKKHKKLPHDDTIGIIITKSQLNLDLDALRKETANMSNLVSINLDAINLGISNFGHD
jgi:hypothetical protein